MSKTRAEARARALREALLDHGVPRVSIELQQGRPGTPNGRWFDTRFIASTGHHIVSRRSQGLTPALGLVKRGRSNLPGPLCNGYGGFDRVARIICLGWANHPGAGGPLSLPGGRIPRDNGRPYLFGWEFEGGIVASDWTDEMREFMGACHAGTLAWLGRDERSHTEHFTWAPLRKIDRLGYSTSSARAEVRAQLTGKRASRSWFDMASKSDLADVVESRINNTVIKHTNYNLAKHIRDISGRTANIRADQATALENQAAILAKLEGRDDGAVVTLLKQHHADYLARFEQAETQREALLTLVESVGSGERDAADVVDEIGRRLRGDDDDPDAAGA